MPLVRLTHCNNVATHVVAKGKISGNCHQYINETSDTCACKYYRRGPKVRVVVDLIEYGKHLEKCKNRIEPEFAKRTF